MSHSAERLHSLDLLRAMMMFLGILLHGMIPFLQTPAPFWAARESENTLLADGFVFVVHDFRMQTFFFLAGFFGCLLYQRYSLNGMLRHRMLRVAIPFALALIIIQPTLQALWLLGDPTAARVIGLEFAADQSIGQRLTNHFLTGRFLLHIEPFHLWFLWFLMLFFVAMIPLAGFGSCLTETRLDRWSRRLFAMPGKLVFLAALTTPLLLPMRIWGMADTPKGWSPSWHLLAYYFLFFLAGWMLRRQREPLEAFTRGWGRSLIIGNLVVLPIFLLLLLGAAEGMADRSKLRGIGYHLAVSFAAASYTWLMIGGLIGAFQRIFAGARSWVRYAADSSYWCYLAHLTPIVALQILLLDAPWPGLVKYAVVIGGTFAILLISYEWGVRYTFVGAILNGRKTRPSQVVCEVSNVTTFSGEPNHVHAHRHE